MWYIFFVQYKPTTFNLISSFLDRTMFGNLHKVDTFKKSKRKTRIVGAILFLLKQLRICQSVRCDKTYDIYLKRYDRAQILKK